jgi:asparagine synthase (glutamine-hydrolysing)
VSFFQNSARLTVPGGASVACSTEKAIEWDASWSGNLDPSGRAALGVHVSAYENKINSVTKGVEPEKIIPKMGISPLGVAIQS